MPSCISVRLLVVLALISGNLRAQSVASIKKIPDSIGALDFDGPTGVLIRFTKKEEVLNVSYIKLRGKKSYIETVRQELKEDSMLQLKYPISCSDCADPATGRFNRAKYEAHKTSDQSPNVIFKEIPEGNFIPHGDTLIVRFAEDSKYKLDPGDICRNSYWREYVSHGKIKLQQKTDCDALKTQYQYLEPNSRYALMIFLKPPGDVLKLFDLLDESFINLHTNLPKAVAAFKKAQALFDKTRQSQFAISDEEVFFPDFNACTDIYISQIGKYYAEIHKAESARARAVRSFSSSAHLTVLRKNTTLSKFLNFERQAQNKNEVRPGMAIDSLTSFETGLSNLYAEDSVYYTKLLSGAISLRQPVISKFNEQPDSAAANLTTSLNDLNRLRALLNDYYAQNALAVDSPPYSDLQVALDSLIGKLSSALEESKKITEQRGKITKAISQSFESPIILNESTLINNLQTRGQLVLVPDFGLIWYGFIPYNANKQFTSISPYFGVEVNWRPLDKNWPYHSIPYNKWYSLSHWSTMVGVTLISVAYPGKRTDLFSNTSLMLGMGYRLGSAIRIIGGALFFDKYTSYFSINKNLAATPYAGVSIDLDFKKIFEPIVSAFTGH